MSSSTLVALVSAPPRSHVPEAILGRARIGAAAGFIIAVFLAFLGFAGDVKWHTAVGPDTFFTAAHLVLYGGVAIAGLASLAMVLLATWYAELGVPGAMSRAAATPILGGRFR